MTALRPLAIALVACAAAGNAGDAGSVAPDRPARTDAEAIAARLPTENDPTLRAARDALAADASWRATAALAPLLADSTRRSPAAALLAAAAAAEREEWATVDRLARGVADSAGMGFAPLLLARSALARGVGAPPASRVTYARAALDAARRAAAHAPDAAERGVRLVIAARALDRLASLAERDTTRDGLTPAAAALADSARAAYTAAMPLLPSVSDWLALRAAAVTRDSSARARAYASLSTPSAREHAEAAEADARERSGDRLGAARAYAAIGRRVKALSLQLADAGADESRRSAIRDSLVHIVTAQSGTGEARAAVELLDSAYTVATVPDVELAIARSAAASGPPARAVSGFEHAFAAGRGTPRDHYSYATLLGRTGRARDAVAEFARVRAAAGELAGMAAYQRARLLARTGSAAESRAALQEVVDAFGGDTSAATSALALLADLAVDDGRDGDARALLLRLARQYPRSERAPRARFDAAIIALAAGDAAAARRELDALGTESLRAERPITVDTTPSEEAIAATYWAGRAAQAAGDEAAARARWREVASRVPWSYYAMLAARRLGVSPWRPNGDTSVSEPSDAAVATVHRIALLERLGFDPEMGWERDWLARWADSSSERLVAAAAALRDAGIASPAIRLARRALDKGAPPTTAVYRALYPWPWESLVRESARARGVDPALAAAVIRQESNFTPNATSPAGAIGLMQVMPPVGRSIWDALGAERAGVPWGVALLRQPDVNVALGMRHLEASLGQYPDVAYALAAYNAGGTPVARWRRRAGANDPELFVERIAYDETRDYVRIVSRNRAFYAGLYGR